MASTAGWPEVVRVRAARLGLGQNQLSIFAGVHQVKLSRGLAGLEPLSNENIQKLDETLKALEHLIEIIPFPLDLRKIDRINELLNQVRLGDLGSVLIMPRGKSLPELSKQLEELNASGSGELR
jgi:hypothetical protein